MKLVLLIETNFILYDSYTGQNFLCSSIVLLEEYLLLKLVFITEIKFVLHVYDHYKGLNLLHLSIIALEVDSIIALEVDSFILVLTFSPTEFIFTPTCLSSDMLCD